MTPCSILLSGSDLQKPVREMNTELELISEWFKATQANPEY